MALALGIDIGTTNTKVALVDVGEPEVRAVASAPTPAPGELKGVLLELIGRVLAGAAAPEAVGIASMAETGVPLNASQEPMSPWLRWDNGEAGAAADGLASRLGREQLIGATGVRPSAKVPLAKLAWLREHRPEVWRGMTAWAGVADLACLLLTGQLATDHTLAGRTMAYRLASPLPEAFDADLLAEVGLRPAQLPAVVPPGEIAGRVTDPDFAASGLRAGTPVVVAGHDHQVGAYACGVRSPGDVADSVGTAEAVMTVVSGHPDPVRVGRAGMSSVVTVGGRHRAILAGSAGAGATIAWWLTREPDTFGEVPALGDDPTGVLVLPYLTGRQTPAPDSGARFRVIGRRPEHRPAELAKALLEGLSLHARWMLDEQLRLAGETAAPSVFLFGAPVAANPAWVRVKAHVQPTGVRVVREPEPVAAGAALLAAVRAGVGPGQVLASETVPGGGAAYDAMLARFVHAAVLE
ncbi:FGGY family carbohydrate kinase [Actinoplanes sp. NPDC049596]|uniref:FGGY-family carbohydrate kinase n=1 Tax=unclassified Actinoplanes TaxID=2626549 RepID=UPI003429DB3D